MEEKEKNGIGKAIISDVADASPDASDGRSSAPADGFKKLKYDINIIISDMRKAREDDTDKKQMYLDWNNKTQEIEKLISKYKDDESAKASADFALLQIAHITKGFTYGGISSADARVIRRLYKKAVQTGGADTELLARAEDYVKRMNARRRNRIIISAGAAALVLVAAFLTLFLYSPTLTTEGIDVSVSIPQGSLSIPDKLAASVEAELKADGTSAYVDAKNALRDETEKFYLYDIAITAGGEKLDPSGPVTVRLPIPKGYDESALAVYYVASESSYTEIPKSDISISGGYISFVTDHFSYYAIAERHPRLSFESGCDDTVPTQTVKRDTIAAEPKAPIKEGYTLIGWKLGDKLWNFDTDAVREDITLTAAWQPNSYTVTLSANGAELPFEELSITFDSEFTTLPESVTFVGFDFLGWYTAETGGTVIENGSVMKTPSDITLYARFTPKSNTLKLDANGGEGEMSAVKLNTGATSALPACTYTKLGHTFIGWSVQRGGDVLYTDKAEYVMGSESEYTLYAVWQTNTNRLVFDGNGSTGGTMDAEEHLFGSEFNLTLCAFLREGYTFDGWSTLPGDDPVYKNGDDYTMGDRAVYTLYAHWVPNVNTVKFNAAGGIGSMKNQSITYGEGAYLFPNEFVKDGYDFKGWSETEGGAIVCTDGGWYYVGTDSECILYAVWAPRENRIIFDPNGGVGTMENVFTIPTNGERELPENPFSKTGYVFETWCTTSDGTGTHYSAGDVYKMTKSEDITLYAIWKTEVYTVNYVTNTDVTVDGSTYTIESGLILPTNVTAKAHYTFGGWYDNEGLEGEAVKAISEGSFGNKTYYAKWIPVSYTVTYVTNGGTVLSKGSYTVENAYTLSTDTRKLGYSLGGWYDNAELAGEAVESIAEGSFGNKIYYAKWDIVTYKILFDTGCSVKLDPIEFTIETETFELYTFNEGVNPGYKNCGWYKTPVYNGEQVKYIAKGTCESMILYAKWEPEKYNITYVTEGIYIDPEEYTVRDKVILPTPERDGYVFAGWYADEAYSGEAVKSITEGSFGNKTYYAKWDIIEYKITLHGTSGDTVIEYNIKTPSFDITQVDEKSYYDFHYWERIDKTPCYTIPMGSFGDIDLYPNHTPTDYVITFDTHGGTPVPERHYNVESETFELTEQTLYLGYKFAGWYTDSTYSGLSVKRIEAGTNGNITLHAKWEIEIYDVIFVTNGGNPIDKKQYTVKTGIPSLPKAYRGGYDFIGWHMDSALSDQAITSIPIGTTGHITLYADWSEPIEYKITFVTNGGLPIDDITYTVKDTVKLPRAVYSTYAQYNTFSGWYDNSSLSGESVGTLEKGTTGDKTFYADWYLFETVYDSIDSTPFTVNDERIIVDWRGEADVNLLNHTSRVGVIDGRYNNIDIFPGVSEIIFIGDADKVYENLTINFCYFTDGEIITVRLVDFNFKTNASNAMTVYESGSATIVFVIEGNSSIIGTTNSNVINVDGCRVWIQGSGNLTLEAGKGSDDTGGGGKGSDGGTAVIADYVKIINMTGKLTLKGGDGGAGSKGLNGNGGDLGETGHKGGAGGSGGSAIIANEVYIYSGELDIAAGQGGQGGQGGKGDEGHGIFDQDGNGGSGGQGGSGGIAIDSDSITIALYGVSGEIAGGSGGNGGRGGNGGSGGVNESKGGTGGAAGVGGAAISCEYDYIGKDLTISNGTDGTKGANGSGT